MRRQLISIAIAAGTVLAAIPDVQAMPPRQHSVNGVIETIDCASRTITLKSTDGAARLTFVWNDSTRFSRKGGCAKCSFNSGQTVHGWYCSAKSAQRALLLPVAQRAPVVINPPSPQTA